MVLVLLVAALVCCILGIFGTWRFNLVAAGLACWAASQLVGRL